jgi:hypothetical protein
MAINEQSLVALRGWDASCCVIIIGKEVKPKKKLVFRQNLVFQYCKILPDDGPYRPKHVVMFHV